MPSPLESKINLPSFVYLNSPKPTSGSVLPIRSVQDIPISSNSSISPSPSLSTPSYQRSGESSMPESIFSSIKPLLLLSTPSAYFFPSIS